MFRDPAIKGGIPKVVYEKQSCEKLGNKNEMKDSAKISKPKEFRFSHRTK